MTVINAYEIKYGRTGERAALSMLGGDPAPIIADYEARLNQPDPLLAMLGEPLATADDLADALHHAIRRAIEAAYFAEIPRPTARELYHALQLAPRGALTVWSDMTYTGSAFAHAWQETHPAERPLSYEDAEYFV